MKGVGPVCWCDSKSCAKMSYPRGVGRPMECKAGTKREAGLCYNPCPSGLKNVGPVCWGSCPSGWKPCGALCLKPDNKDGCTAKIKEMATNAGKATAKAYTGNPKGFYDAAKFAGNLVYPICK